MKTVRITNVGAGVNKDLSTHELPPNVWTDARNIRFQDGSALQGYGHSAVYSPVSGTPFHVLPVSVSGNRYWVYANSSAIYCVNGTTHSTLTGASGPYAGGANTWTSAVVGGVPVLNDGNGTKVPQAWALNPSNPCTDLTAWPASTYCKSIRAYKNYLVALNITKGTTNYPFMVKWSHPATPGSLPSSWDHTDPTKDAGEADLAEGQDVIVDGMQLRDSFMIYKENSVWRMDWVGGTYVHRIQKVLGQSGSLARNCIAEIDGRHFILAGSDVVIHDGNSAISALDRQTRRWLFANIDQTNYKSSFVFKNPYMNEVYACFPSSGATVPNMAVVYNYADGTNSIREMPNVRHAACGLVESGLGPLTWDSDTDPWNSDVTTWGQMDFTPDAERVILGSNNDKLYLLDSTTSFDGTPVSSYLERVGLSFDEPDRIKFVSGIKPRIKGQMGGTVRVRVGTSTEPYEEPTWSDPVDFTIGTSVQCDFHVSGRYIGIRFETGTAAQWRLDSYDVLIEDGGAW